jgi:serine O-acetyltransferase
MESSGMIISIGEENLVKLVTTQLENNFLCDSLEAELLKQGIAEALLLTQNCFREVTSKYYWDKNEQLIFNPFHSAQYNIFLYFLSHLTWRKYENPLLADKIYYLNKMLNSCDLFYEVHMPAIFSADHPVGSVIGRGSFKNYFVFQQNCTVGQNKGIYPIFGEFVWLFASSAVIGSSRIGNNVFVSAGAYVKDEDVPDNTIVFGRSPNLILKEKSSSYFYRQSPFRQHRIYAKQAAEGGY